MFHQDDDSNTRGTCDKVQGIIYRGAYCRFWMKGG